MGNDFIEAPSVPAAKFSPTIKITADQRKRVHRAAELESAWHDLSIRFNQRTFDKLNRTALRALPGIPLDEPERVPGTMTELAAPFSHSAPATPTVSAMSCSEPLPAGAYRGFCRVKGA